MIRVVFLLALILATASPASGQNARTNGVERVQAVVSGTNTAENEIRALLEQSVREALSLESATDAKPDRHLREELRTRLYIRWIATELFTLVTDILNEIRDKGPNRRKFSIRRDARTPQLRIHGDTAVATYVMRYSEQRADGALNSSIRESAVFVRRDGRWLRILEQRNNLNSPR